jgi:hypothetical protein
MEAALKENIHFMWLSGMSKPDHNTLNRFRSDRLKDVLKEVFAEVVKMLIGSGHVGLQEVYTDGTKIEANANRYTFVWGNPIKMKEDHMMNGQLKPAYIFRLAQKIHLYYTTVYIRTPTIPLLLRDIIQVSRIYIRPYLTFV